MNGEDEVLAVRASELHYQEDLNQSEIAAQLGITRWKVGRLLAYARETGIVRIEIAHPKARRLPLERALVAHFGLHAAVVVPTSPDAVDTSERVSAAAADYLASLRPRISVLGISWGRTLQQLANALPDGWARGVEVVQVNGGVTVNRRGGMASATATTIAQKGGGNVTLLPSPAILEESSTKEAIEKDRFVSAILDKASRASAVVFSAGPVSEESVLVTSGYLDPADVAELRRKGAVGDVLGRFIDADGNIADPGLDARTLGLGLEELRQVGAAIAVVSGRDKTAVARAIVENAYCSVLVTDEATAQNMLEGGSA